MAGRGAVAGVLGAGFVVVVVARLLLPAAPPLYDGIVPIEPYLWLDPPAGDAGGAKGATAQLTDRSGKSPLVAVATPELEPQAQIFAPPEGLTIPPGGRTIKVTIEPIPSEGTPADGHIDGNVYRISVVDENGVALTAPASARVSVVMRATDPAQAEATIARFSAGTWQPLKTSPSGFGGSFVSVVTNFGDFAVITPGPGPSLAASTAGATAAGGATGDAASAGFNTPAGSTAPLAPAGDTSFPPGWLPPALVAAALLVGVVAVRTTRRRRPDRGPYRGAHPTRRR
ncbi:MAG TPA: hypothetical protein VE640_04440 [Candidatus Bathyarchaeia archaeon]|nr:hypothetical protein [Candidatus Bathyarchaeia archaeon]